MPLEELVFEQELDWRETPELLECSRELCHEQPEHRAKAIEELRQMIYERGEVAPYRMDDAHLIKFLRARLFIPKRAHRLMVNYYKFRNENPHLYEGVDAFSLAKLGEIYCSPMFDRPDVGRLIILRLGLWDPYEMPIEDVVRGGLLMLEIGIISPKLQIVGGSAMVDLEGLTLAHISRLTPLIASNIVNMMGKAFPNRIRSYHIVNNSRLMTTFYYLFKPLIPQSIQRHVHFHGYDLSSLHEHISKDCLPKRYGGNLPNLYSLRTWLTEIQKRRDKALDKELKGLGYYVSD